MNSETQTDVRSGIRRLWAVGGKAAADIMMAGMKHEKGLNCKRKGGSTDRNEKLKNR